MRVCLADADFQSIGARVRLRHELLQNSPAIQLRSSSGSRKRKGAVSGVPPGRSKSSRPDGQLFGPFFWVLVQQDNPVDIINFWKKHYEREKTENDELLKVVENCREFREESRREIAMLEKNLYSWKELYDESKASIADLRYEKAKLLIKRDRHVNESESLRMEI